MKRAPFDLPDRDRKAEHIELGLDPRMQIGGRHFDRYSFEHRALPEIDFDQIDVSIEFLGRRLAAPLLISCMTGGTGGAARINQSLALAAERTGIAIGVGSQRKALEDPSSAESFRIRRIAPSVPLLANLGAVQLNYGCGVAECRKVVEMIEADALVLHLNPLQEAVQPEGQRNFAGLLDRIEQVAAGLEHPVIVKEVGCGIDRETARALLGRGVRIIDVAGQGGTSWARIEAARADDAEAGERFAGWGIPTPLAIERLATLEGLTVIGSGGLRNGLDLAKAIALGASLGGMAYPFLKAADQGPDVLLETISRTIRELKICMFCVGARTIDDLRRVELLRPGGG